LPWFRPDLEGTATQIGFSFFVAAYLVPTRP